MLVLLLLHRFSFAFRFRTPQAQECTLSLPYLPVKFAHRFCALFLQRSGALPLTWQLGRPADPHHFYDALRYESSSYNTWIRTANPLGSVSLNVLYLSQCVWQHTLVIAISFLRQAQECRLLLLLRKVKFLNLLFHLISPSRSFLRHGERKADKTTAKKLELPACATCVWAIHGN